MSERPEEEAADAQGGEDQEPEQSEGGSFTEEVWDTEEHSDAPGPFGTGEEGEGEE